MSLLEAVVLGLVQGLTEFLPISSTAHLRIVPALLGWEDPGAAYSAIIQLGTVIAVLDPATGRLTSVTDVLRDISARKALESANQAAREQADDEARLARLAEARYRLLAENRFLLSRHNVRSRSG